MSIHSFRRAVGPVSGDGGKKEAGCTFTFIVIVTNKVTNDLHEGITAEALETPNRGLSALTWKPNTFFLKGLWLPE